MNAYPTKDEVGGLGLWAGIGGLGFLASVLIENVLRAGMPWHGAPAAEIAAWYRDHRAGITISEGFYASAIPCLMLFSVGTYLRARRGAGAAGWALVGLIGLVMMTPMFGLVMGLDVVLNASVATLSTRPELIELLWRMKSVAFVFNVLALSTGLAAMGVAAGRTGIGPRWLSTASVVAGVSGIASATLPRYAVEGSPIGGLGFIAFVCWMAFIVVHSIGHLRASAAATPAVSARAT